jgi:hypothetical protein
VSDEDLGEASAVNDAAARVGALLMVALVPVLVGVGAGELGPALADGFRPAMLVMFSLAVAAAVVTALFVSDRPTVAPPTPPQPLIHSCALAVGERALAGTARS